MLSCPQPQDEALPTHTNTQHTSCKNVFSELVFFLGIISLLLQNTDTYTHTQHTRTHIHKHIHTHMHTHAHRHTGTQAHTRTDIYTHIHTAASGLEAALNEYNEGLRRCHLSCLLAERMSGKEGYGQKACVRVCASVCLSVFLCVSVPVCI